MEKSTVFGQKVTGKTLLIPESLLVESVPGEIYQLEIDTNGVPDPVAALEAMRTQLYAKFHAKVVYAEFIGNHIRLQLEGSPFAWAALLLFLPQILVGVGIAVVLIVTYLVVSSIPSWVYGLAALAVVLVVASPSLLKRLQTPTLSIRG